MFIERLSLTNFRCFGPEATSIGLTSGLTTFVGVNGAGKTALMQSLQRLFGVTGDQRRLRRQDFHVPAAELVAPLQRSFVLEAISAFPELDTDGSGGAAIPEFFHQMAAEEGGKLKCRLRLEATWTDDGSLDGAIEQKYWAVRTFGEFTDADCTELKATDRARIQMIYVPATRDGASQVTAFVRGRLWRAINWSQAVRGTFTNAGAALNGAFAGEPAVDLIAVAVTRRWQEVYTAGTDTTPVFRPLDLRFEQFIRKVEVVFRPDEAGRERALDDLSDGQRSLFHLAMTAATLDVEAGIVTDPAGAGFQAGGVPLPALTLIAIEEPENNLAPFYLSRIVRQIQDLTKSPQAQAVVSSHSPSILARVDPTQVRHFRLDPHERTARIRPINLPVGEEEASKFIREAVRTYPELYFARFVVLGEGASEEVVLPRLAEATFDAFTKSLVDRFLNAIPADWRPTRPYEIAFPKRKAVEGFLTLARLSAPPHWQAEIAGYSADDFEAKIVGSYRLPVGPIVPQNAAEFTIARWWATQLRPEQPSLLTFIGINRLAELLLRANPHIRRALVATYPFVFVDEFQDTTYAQYDFLHSAFSGGQTIITGVGDDKQRIMVFAGARKDAFQRLQMDFQGSRFPLVFNFRSSPDLVAIQHVVARALDPNTVQTVAQTVRQVNGDVAQVWSSQTMAEEAAYLAHWIANDMAARSRAPRDYALLVKQKSDDYEQEFAGAFAAQGLRIRNESHTLGKTSLQDLLSDELSRLAIAIFRLGASRRAPAAWQLVSSSVLALRVVGQDDDVRAAKVETELTAFLAALRADMAATPPSEQSAVDFATRVFDYLDLDAIARTYAEYGVGDQLQIILEAFCIHFFGCADGAPDWTSCLDAFEGLNQIPMMTVHKSKGLEYDTIIFVGLDDRAWWSHTPGDPEGVAAFFVALSRAKQRAIFAFCQQRGQRNNVAELYQLLTAAGVPDIAV